LGFILDNSNLDGRVFTQTAGPSIYDFASYTPIVLTAANTTSVPVAQTSRRFDVRDSLTRTNEVNANVNATYDFDTKFPLQVKVGLDSINRRVNSIPNDIRRWYGVVGSVLNVDLMPISRFESQQGGGRVAAFKPSAVNQTLGNAALWYEDVNFNATSRYGLARRILEEGVDSGYIQMQGRFFNRLTLLGGVRHERVTTDTFNYFRARTTPIAVQPDHYLRAAMDFQSQTTSGDYSKNFPSVHASYDILPNLKARASWSTSYGRPTLQQLLPGATANDTAQTVTIGNPSLLPQEAENVDLKLEYYFKNNGMFSVGVFKKKITDYISGNLNSGTQVPSGPENGFEGLYAGYTIFRPANIGDAEFEGIEVDYRQRLAFLPGALKGLTVSANYTYQRTEGRFSGTTLLTSQQVPGIIPRLFNARLLYNYKKFGASFDASYKGQHVIIFSTTAGASRFQRELLRYNAGFTWRLRPDATLFLNFDNIGEDGPEQYFIYQDRTSQVLKSPSSIKFGVTGTF
jgi:TonB-dependent receptor